MSLVSKCLNATATNGYVIALGQNCTYLAVKVDGAGEAYIQPVYASSTPTTPTNAFIPGSGATVSTNHLSAAEPYELDFAKGRAGEHLQDSVNYVRVWCVATGKINVMAF